MSLWWDFAVRHNRSPFFTTLVALLLIASVAAGAEGGAAPHFAILEFRVLGNTVLPNIDVERAVYEFLGEDKSFADIESARAALEAAYHAHDYGTVFVDIPEQQVNDGIVRLHVTEGRLRVARLEGARYFSERQVRAEIPEAAPGKVPRLGELQKELAAVNTQTADRTVVPILKAGPYPGTVDLALKVDDHLPLHLTVELNNQYSVDTDHLRGSVGLSYGNLFGQLDSIALQYQTTPTDLSQVGVFAGSYTSRPFGGGIRAAVTYIHSSSSVSTVGTLGVLGKGDIWSGRITIPVEFSTASTQSAFVGVDYKHFRDDIEVDANSSLLTPISYLNFTAGFNGDWRAEARQWSLGSSVNLGVRSLVNDADQFEEKRYLARPNYFYVRGDGSVVQALPAGFAFKLRLAGQFAADPIISNENFVITGADGVRGYLEAEELGDAGLKGTAQLDSPAWHPGSFLAVKGLVFYDAGRTHVLDPLDSQPAYVILSSYGAGFELTGRSSFTGDLTWARPLADGATTRRGESSLLFLVRGTF
jgi:hemolysin activation/secretion protein